MGCTPSREPPLLDVGGLVEFNDRNGVVVQARIRSIDPLQYRVELEVVFAGDGCAFYEGMAFSLTLEVVATMGRPNGMLCRMPPLFESEADRLAREARDAEYMRRLGERFAREREERLLDTIFPGHAG